MFIVFHARLRKKSRKHTTAADQQQPMANGGLRSLAANDRNPPSAMLTVATRMLRESIPMSPGGIAAGYTGKRPRNSRRPLCPDRESWVDQNGELLPVGIAAGDDDRQPNPLPRLVCKYVGTTLTACRAAFAAQHVIVVPSTNLFVFFRTKGVSGFMYYASTY